MPVTIFKQSWGAIGSALTVTMVNMPDGSNNQSDEVDNTSTLFLDAHVIVTCLTTGASISSSGTVQVFGFGQVGDTRPWRTDTAGATAGSVPTLANARLLGVIQANSGNTIYAGGPFSVANAFGGILPQKWGVIIGNRTGANLSGSGGVNNVFFAGYYEQGS